MLERRAATFMTGVERMEKADHPDRLLDGSLGGYLLEKRGRRFVVSHF